MNFEINSFYKNAVAALWWNICVIMWIYLFLARDLVKIRYGALW